MLLIQELESGRLKPLVFVLNANLLAMVKLVNCMYIHYLAMTVLCISLYIHFVFSFYCTDIHQSR